MKNKYDRSFWIRMGPLLAASTISLAILFLVSITILNGVSERLIAKHSERMAIDWASYIAVAVDRIEPIAQGASITDREREFLIRVRDFGDIFRFKIFDPEGNLQFVSDSLDSNTVITENLGTHNASAARVLNTGKPFAQVQDGSAKPNRPDIYAEAYVPVYRNGKLVAISEVYIDETATSAQIREDFTVFGLIIAGLTLLILLVPLWALRLLTKELQQRNHDLNIERARAVQAESAKSAFLAHMSHELRTPLNAIQGLSEMMIRGDLGKLEHPKYLEYSKDINFSASHLLKLVNDILDLSKIDAGKYELVESDLDISDSVDAALRIARAWSIADHLRLKTDLRQGMIVARADHRLLKQILLNLLSNAAKFTPAGGEVCVSGNIDAAGNAVISVTDTGHGIPEEDLDSILEPFNQLQGLSGLQQEGTGLGLSLVKSMVEMHGGRVTVDSVVDEGTTVTFTLPAERIMSVAATE